MSSTQRKAAKKGGKPKGGSVKFSADGDGGLPVTPMSAIIMAVCFILIVLLLHILNKIIRAAF